MPTPCLICNSAAVMSQDTAKTIVLLFGTLEGFLRGVRQPRTHSPHVGREEQALHRLADGLSGAVSGWADSTEFIKDVQKYQFRGYNVLCLRCGALFDEPVSE